MGERLFDKIDLIEVDNRTKAVAVDTDTLNGVLHEVNRLTKQAPFGFSIKLVIARDFSDTELKNRDIFPLQYEEDTPYSLFEYQAARIFCSKLANRRIEALYKHESGGNVHRNLGISGPAFWQRYAFPPFYVGELLAKDAIAKDQKPFVCVERNELTDLIVCPGMLDETLSLEVDMDEVDKLGEMFGLDGRVIRIIVTEVVASFSDLADPFFIDADGGVNLLADVKGCWDGFGGDKYYNPNERKHYNYQLRDQVIKALMLSRLYLNGWWDNQESWYRAKKEGMKAALSLAPDYQNFIRIVEVD